MRKDFYKLSRQELRLQVNRALLLLKEAKTFISKSGYRTLKFENNVKLHKLLESLGFFEMHVTNNGNVAGVHQIVLYLHRGIWRMRYSPKKCVAKHGYLDVHHLDNNKLNNDPRNLWYVTPQQNSLAANLFSQKYVGLIKSGNVKHWYKLGGGACDTAKLMWLTAQRTLEGLGFDLQQIPLVAEFLLKLPGNLGNQIIRNWQFNMNFA